MLRRKPDKNGTTGAGGISSIVVVWLILGCSRPAFSEEQRHLQLAPIRFSTTAGGYVDYTFLRNTYGGSGVNQQALNAAVNLNLRASSFIWQPWLARVSGSIGLGVGDGINSTSNAPSTTSGNKSITGDADLNVLAYSRFPFDAHAFRTNSQTTGFLSDINSDYITSGYSLAQTYRSRDGRLDAFGSYNRTNSGRIYYGTEDVNDQLNLTFATEPLHGHYTFRVVGLMNSLEHPLKGDSSIVDSLIADHLYRPNDYVQVGSFFNAYKNTLTLAPANKPKQQNDSSARQFTSIGSWRSDVSPLSVVGSVRLLEADSTANGIDAPKTNDTNFNVGANYSWSPLINMYGSVNVNDNGGIQTTSTNAALTAQKGIGEREQVAYGGWRYTQSAGGSLSNSTNTVTSGATNISSQTSTTSIQSLGGNLGHDLSKTTPVGDAVMSTNLNQSISTGINSVTAPITRLNTNGTWNWNSLNGRTRSIVMFRVSDSRYLSYPNYFAQLVNLQASRDQQMAHNQSLIGTLTLQGSRTGARGHITTPFVLSPSAALNYRHERLFTVKHLNFTSSLSIIGADIVASQGTSPEGASTQTQASADWTNELDYFVGRLRMQLKFRIAEINQTTQSSIYFNMNRSF